MLAAGSVVGLYYHVKPELPDVATLIDVELQTPMLVYSEDGLLISQFGEKRRIPLKYNEIPRQLINALIATEDSRFYDHHGIDPIGIARAAIVVAMSGSAKQGASTITQQLARNFFLSNEKKIMRKIKEIFIAIHIEELLSKQAILELYINKVFLGHRSYGFGAAAQIYFNKNLHQLTLSEIATLAGMPKAPSTMNPIYSISRATDRRNIVLMRMLDEGYITEEEYQKAKAEKLVSRYHGIDIELSAPYMAEMTRAWAVERFGQKVYESGYKIYTTIDSRLQIAAEQASINNLLKYDERHGYRGAVSQLWDTDFTPWTSEQINQHLEKQPQYGELIPAVVTYIDEESAAIQLPNLEFSDISWDNMKWARPFVTDEIQGTPPKSPSEILAEGQQIWVRFVNDQWMLSQVPDANTAMVAMSPNDGAIKALVGGFHFKHSKFNRATQSVRQVGSTIKPFVYSAALEHGMTLASLVNDAPINHWDASQGVAWRPKNSPPTYDGPTRIRKGLAQSKNVMAVRVLRNVGLDKAIDFLTRFGFQREELPRTEAIALGAGNLTPMQMVQGFSVFANGGYYLTPFYISKVVDPFGQVIYSAIPHGICSHDCEIFGNTPYKDEDFEPEQVIQESANLMNFSDYAPQVLSSQNAFLVREMLEANIWGGGDWSKGSGWNGTGWRAQKPLKRRDIGGKTGTTNDSKDVWYTGYGPDLVATVWLGFDDHNRPLGRTRKHADLGDGQITGAESGGKTAQPAWIEFMDTALQDTPVKRKILPPEIISVRIDRKSGLLSRKNDGTSLFEYFQQGTEPTEYDANNSSNIYESGEDELF